MNQIFKLLNRHPPIETIFKSQFVKSDLYLDEISCHSWKSVKNVIVRNNSKKSDFNVIDSYGNKKYQGFFAIYDGFNGRMTSFISMLNLHKEYLRKQMPNLSEEQIWTYAYEQLDNSLFSYYNQGCSIVSAVIKLDELGNRLLSVANVGNLSLIIIQNGYPVRFTEKHTEENIDEKERINSIYGFHNQPLLTTRGVGAHYLKPWIISIPHTTVVPLTDDISHIILFSSEIEKNISDFELVNIILSHHNLSLACDEIIKRSEKGLIIGIECYTFK